MSHAKLSRKINPAAVRNTIVKTVPAWNLPIGEPNDSFEQEADRVAEEVMTGRGLQNWSIANVAITTPLQRKCACGGSGNSTGKCAECKEKKALQRKAIGPARLQANVAPPIVHEVLNSPGQPLDKATRDFFEPRFGYDLSCVRLHYDAQAAESARAVHALAYAAGQDLVFAAGQYETGTSRGLRLIAHELTHVIQQNGTLGMGSHVSSKKAPAEKQDQDARPGSSPSTSTASRCDRPTLQRTPAEVEEEEDDRHRIPVVLKRSGGILQRQGPNIPPPPPPYPHFTEIYLGEVADEITSLQLTCSDRRERGFWIYWDMNSRKAKPGDTVIGEPAPKDCSGASVNLGPMPKNRGNLLVAGYFHNHPPQWPQCRQITVGPSPTDRNTASRLKLPGLVEDFMTPGANITCKGGPRGIFFFGPPRRTD